MWYICRHFVLNTHKSTTNYTSQGSPLTVAGGFIFPFSKKKKLGIPLMYKTKFHTHTKQYDIRETTGEKKITQDITVTGRERMQCGTYAPTLYNKYFILVTV
jgi:hypothetical protein